LAVVIGGLTSVPFAVLGAVSFEAFVLFGPRFYQGLGQTFIAVVPLLLTGPLLVLDLYFYPGGSAEGGFQARDKFLRWVARRHNLVVPSLVADRRVEAEEEAKADVVTAAERHVEELDGFDVLTSRTITCPLCNEVMDLDAAVEHDHPTGGGERGMVQVPGGRAVFPTLTVAEHFRCASWLYVNEGRAEVESRVEHVLGLFPRLRERWAQMAGNLSGGEQQQLGLGMAFVAKPKLLMIDELSLGLAPTIVEQLLGIV